MKKYLLLLFMLVGINGFSQGWQSVDQSGYNVKYKLPDDWSIDGFGGEDWDDYGSSVCECSGTINFGGDNGKLGMVIYPFNNKTDGKRREKVWDYHFVDAELYQDIKTKKLTFRKEVSVWELTSGSDEYMGMLDDVVWKLTAQSGKNGLIIYFWGDADLMQQNESNLLKILDSMVMIKK